jgi:hypothetical protein
VERNIKTTKPMTTENFAYWLKGFIELNGTGNGLTPDQLGMVKRHLDLVFTNVTDDQSNMSKIPMIKGIGYSSLDRGTLFC